jgi:glycosyltransferase involved in cell wall biosynthesis
MARAASIPAVRDYERPPLAGHPRVSVITTVRNGEKTLARTIDSVRAQEIPDLEYIIVDAGSRDSTLDIVRANTDVVTLWKSEPDRGISDGFNKGIVLAQGKYVTLLNADDWLSPGQLAYGIETLERTGADFVFGDLTYHDGAGVPLYRIAGEENYARRIGHVMPALNHPSVIVRRDVYERFGLFDLNLKLAMDYELLLRLHRAGCRGVYDSRILGHMSLEGASDAQSRAALAEVRDISIRHGEPPLSARLRFLFRLVKGDMRRLLERTLPAPLFERLRKRANGNFSQIAR